MELPLHLTISEKLREQILSGQIQAGEQLPSEHQLIDRFGVSRITVRRAISNLVHQGLVVARQGKGVFVKEQRKVTYSLSSPLVFFEADMSRQGIRSAIENLVFEPVLAPVEVQQALRLTDAQATVYLQKKLLVLDDRAVAIDITYILAELGERLAEELQQQMTFPVLEKNGVTIEQIEATLECTRADAETSRYLNVPLGDPLLVYCYTAYSRNHTPIICGKALSRGDRLCYSVVLTT